jgi:flagellar biosynthesis chaperone FliJ
MEKEALEAFLVKLDEIIAISEQTIVLSGRVEEEREAYEALQDARSQLVEALGEKKQE